jgi:cytochrome c oxidase assembly protein subunit 15
MFALLVVVLHGALAFRLVRTRTVKALGWLLAGGLLVQFSLGVANVALRLPLVLAAAHNAGAALLLVLVVVINYVSFHGLAVHRSAHPPPA